MTVQWSTALRNALLDAWEAAIGVSAKVQIRTGPAPANCAAADSGTLLAEFSLVSDWAAPAASGAKSLNGTPTANAIASGDAAHYRIKDSSGVTCHEQGRVTVTGGGGDLTVDIVSVSSGQPLRITAWAKTAPGA